MKVHDSAAPLICEYPQGDSYFGHDRSPPFLSATIHLEPGLGESDPKSSTNSHDDRIIPAAWGYPIDLANFDTLGGGVEGNGRDLLGDYSSNPYSTTTRSVGHSLTPGASGAKAKPYTNGIGYQGLSRSITAHNAESSPNWSWTADLSVGHHTCKNAIDHSLPQNHIVQTDAEEIFSVQGNNNDDNCEIATNPVGSTADIAAALRPNLDSHPRAKDEEQCLSITESGGSLSSTRPEVICSCLENNQHDSVTMPNPHLSQISTDTSTSSPTRSRQGYFSGELRRPHRSYQRVAYDVPLYGFEIVDISLSHFSRLNRAPLTLEHESIELDNLSILAQSHREHIWSVAHEDEYGWGLEGDGGQERLREARHKRVRRWAPLAAYEATSNIPPHGHRSGGHGTMDLAGISSFSTRRRQKPFGARPRPRVIQVPQVAPQQPRVSEAVFGPDSYDEAVANGTDQKRPPLTNRQKTEKVVRRQWKNWLCVALLLSLAITVLVVVKRSYGQGSSSSVGDGDRDGGGAYRNTQTSTSVSPPGSNTSQKSLTAHHTTVVTHSVSSKQPLVTTATTTSNSSAAVKSSIATAVAATSAPKS